MAPDLLINAGDHLLRIEPGPSLGERLTAMGPCIVSAQPDAERVIIGGPERRRHLGSGIIVEPTDPGFVRSGRLRGGNGRDAIGDFFIWQSPSALLERRLPGVIGAVRYDGNEWYLEVPCDTGGTRTSRIGDWSALTLTETMISFDGPDGGYSLPRDGRGQDRLYLVFRPGDA